MSEQIKVGDLVMVVGPTQCCGASTSMYTVHTVLSVIKTKFQCGGCGFEEEGLYAELNLNRTYRHCQVYRLKKINPPPIAEDETTGTDLEVTA